MQMQTAETEPLTLDRLMDQGIRAMAAEPHLAHCSAVQGPIDQPGALAMEGPVEMAVQIQPVNRQVVESLNSETLKASPQSGSTLVKAETRQQLAGDDPAMAGRLDPFAVQLRLGLTQKGFGGSIGRGRF